MIEGVADGTKYIYHYTNADVALNFILKNGTIKFGSYLQTNDPKESKSWEFRIGTNENRDLSEYNFSEVSSWLSETLKGQTKLVCFSLDQEPLSGSHIQDICKRGFAKPRMWAQYGDNHAGVCLVFNVEKFLATAQKAFTSSSAVSYGPVSYVDRSIVPSLNEDHHYMVNIDALEDVGESEYAARHLKSHYERLFFEKMDDWQTEKEWRMIVFSDASDDLFFDYEDSLEGVVFGDRCKDEAIDEIIKLAGDSIRYMGLKWSNCSPWYNYQDLRYLKNAGPWGASA